MKQTVLAVAVLAALGLSACSTTRTNDVGSGAMVSPGNQQAISDQRLQSNYKRQGIRITYTWGGDIESIETTGYAAVWGNSENAAREAYRVAEMEAKKNLNDFINKETITTSKSVAMISKNLEQAKDQKTNKFATNKNRDMVASVADDVEGKSADGEVNQEENTAVRNDALQIASKVKTTITVNNRGILGGLYLVEGEVINDGRTVKVVYRWDRKSNAGRQQLRNLMAM